MLDILEWVLDIVALDMRRMSPVGIIFCVLGFGSLSLLLIIVPLIRLMGNPSGTEVAGSLLALALGLPMLARIAYGLYDRWWGRGADGAKEIER